MGTTLSGKLKNCLSDSRGYAMRIGKRIAGALNVSRVLIMATGLLLGFLLLGEPAEVRTQQTSADGDLRLVDTNSGTVIDLDTATAPSGRLEIFDDADRDGVGEWKAICDDYLGLSGQGKGNVPVIGREEAEVACRQLGFSGGTPRTQLAWPAESGYLLDNLECAGSESRILGDGKCRHDPRGEYDCGSDEAFGVTCAAADTNNSDAVGRLAIGGTTQLRQTLTADHIGITDEDGKPTDETSFSYQWIRSDFFWNETEISGATSSTYTLQDADEEHWIKVRVRFTDDAGNPEEVFSFEEGPVYTDLPDGSLRLRPIKFRVPYNDGVTVTFDSNEFTGLVEIYDEPSKKWKGVCDDGPDDENLGWGTEEAQVVCRQLGLAGGIPITRINGAVYPPIYFLLDEVECDGAEDRLLDCDHAERGIHDCISTEYAGVFCEDPDADDDSDTDNTGN